MTGALKCDRYLHSEALAFGYLLLLGGSTYTLLQRAFLFYLSAAISLRAYFRPSAAPHKPAQNAIIATARRLLEVVWHVLKENRPYQTRPPAGSPQVKISSAPYPASVMSQK
jgi:hypothetical protein